MPCKRTHPTSCVLEFQGERGHGAWESAKKCLLVATHVQDNALGPVEHGRRGPVRVHPPSGESVVGRKDPKRGLNRARKVEPSRVGVVAGKCGGPRGGLSCVAKVQIVKIPSGEVGICTFTALDCTSEGEVGVGIGVLLQEGDHGQGCSGAAVVDCHKEPIRKIRGVLVQGVVAYQNSGSILRGAAGCTEQSDIACTDHPHNLMDHHDDAIPTCARGQR